MSACANHFLFGRTSLCRNMKQEPRHESASSFLGVRPRLSATSPEVLLGRSRTAGSNINRPNNHIPARTALNKARFYLCKYPDTIEFSLTITSSSSPSSPKQGLQTHISTSMKINMWLYTRRARVCVVKSAVDGEAC